MTKPTNAYRFISAVSALMVFFLVISGCKKEDYIPIPSEKHAERASEDLLSAAKQFYSANKKLPTSNQNSVPVSLQMLKPDWTKSSTTLNSEDDLVIGVPLSHGVGEYNELVVLRKQGISQGVIKNYRYTDNGNAVLTVYSPTGIELSQGVYSFKDSTYTPISFYTASGSSPLFTTMGETVEGGELEEVVVTPPGGGGGGGGGLPIPVPPVTNPPGGGSGDGNGGGGSAPYIVQVNRALKPCNFNFRPAQGPNWQAAAVTGILIELWPNGPITFNIEVGLPMYSAALNRTISKAEAQSLTASAYISAVQEVNVMFSQGQVTPATIPNKIAQIMQNSLNRALHPTSNLLARATTMVGTNPGAGIMPANFNMNCD